MKLSKLFSLFLTAALLGLPLSLAAETPVLSCAAVATVPPPPEPPQAPAAAPAALRMRLSWQDFIKGPDGAKRLASFQRAVAKMKSLDAAKGSSDPARQKDYMRSWEYWANIHGFFGTASMTHVTVEQFVQQLKDAKQPQAVIDSFNGLTDQTPPNDGVASKVWGTCQHSGKTQADFWGWHRIYLYYFERVLRWAAQDDTLNLPYWDYTNVAHLAVPAEFRDTHSPLFEPKRAPAYNAGGLLPQEDTDADSALGQPVYLTAELTLEQGVHGNVHCDVGGAENSCPQALMGKVPVAGNDPVFYTHHANIDRLWACWGNAHGNSETGAWVNDQFSFPDETGTLRTRKVSEFLTTEAVGYVYEQTTNCMRNPFVKAVAMTQGPKNAPGVLGSVSGIKLTQAKTTVDIAVPREKMLGAQNAAAASEVLVLNNVTAKTPPGTILHVYIEAKGKPAGRKLVGTINWFTAFEHEPGPDVRNVSFDITNQLKTLGVTASAITVTFQAGPGVQAPATKGALTVPKPPSISPNSELTVGSVEIRQQ